MIRKFINKIKNNKKPDIESDSVPEPPRHCGTSNPIPCESQSTGTLVVPSIDSYSSLSQNSTPTQITARTSSPNLNHTIPQSIPTLQLSVNNSHGFHIGDVHNVTVSNGSTANFNANESGLSNLGKPLKSWKSSNADESKETETLEYIYDKIKDWEISLISENVDDNGWKLIGLALDMEENELFDCFCAAGENHHLAANEILRNYMKKFPDTSIGYIISVLRETKQMKAIHQIAKLRL